jgi:hypothetical protein
MQKHRYELKKQNKLKKQNESIYLKQIKLLENDTVYLNQVYAFQNQIDKGLTDKILDNIKWNLQYFQIFISTNSNKIVPSVPFSQKYKKKYNNCDQCNILIKHTHCVCMRLVLDSQLCNHCPACHGKIEHVHCNELQCIDNNNNIILLNDIVNCTKCLCKHKHYHCISCTKNIYNDKCLTKSMSCLADNHNWIAYTSQYRFEYGLIWKYICDDCFDMGG